MIGIDKYAYQSKISGVKASNKLLLSLSLMLICLVFSSDLISILTVSVMSGATIFLGGCRLKRYIIFMLVPLAFLVTGIITIIINKMTNLDGAILYFKLLGSYYGISAYSLKTGINILLKSLGAVSCLYFFSLNTPMNSLLSLLRKRAPGIIVELMELIYRFIFIIWDEAQRMHTAQASRLGYKGFVNSMKSLGDLISNIFIRSLRRVDRIGVALDSRGFDGNFDFLIENEESSSLIICLTAISSAAFIAIGIFERLHK